MILFDVLYEQRRKLRLTQKEVSKKCNITQSYFAQIEKGLSKNPHIDILLCIVKILKLKITDILEV